MASAWIRCCLGREDSLSWGGAGAAIREGGAAGADEGLIFHDCAESEAELEAIRAQAASELRRPPPRISRTLEEVELLARDCSDIHLAQLVLKHARDEWCRRVIKLRREAEVELEWANIATARRMLKANMDDAQKAVQMFVTALELRAQHPQLFRSMRCEVRSDVRIIGRDLQGHPIIYMCARSQSEGLAVVRDQLLVTFEAACRLAGDMGTVAFVVDMHGLQPHLNLDMRAMKATADMLGTVYAERICRITIVDFSRAAQAVWWMLKPLLRPVTKEKFAFINAAQAREYYEHLVDKETHETMCQTIAMNRDPSSTAEERAAHASKTTYCAASTA
mmetsp:Transcript_66864/g.186874  ORF Transcript_66864/g.186874 Transcript_66864/m.186874 type:complete len:335 (-) Transcript_66864:102-1106(-)